MLLVKDVKMRQKTEERGWTDGWMDDVTGTSILDPLELWFLFMGFPTSQLTGVFGRDQVEDQAPVTGGWKRRLDGPLVATSGGFAEKRGLALGPWFATRWIPNDPPAMISSMAIATAFCAFDRRFLKTTGVSGKDRILQCIFAAGSIGVMVSVHGFSNFTAFCCLIASMGLQLLWSFGLACLDAYASWIKKDLCNPVSASLFVVGDWVTATLSLAAACSSAGVAVLYRRDLKFCRGPLPFKLFKVSSFSTLMEVD
ncbi:unnamed protein product [Fraxinus pennsylvanica]|uniref:CASP-like protein n=1 Tax=Fraxinus pennsylvanica TaxID=56036 RepID=A0AAD2A7V8_9LAMI|nr:unnamed protein product [Fraxinus pennsylvanica]